ncbi:accessory Sec system protein Asp3 [Macrococcoides goetzii]|uniref:Accessory Sec system protein Asp3 n=1 Tax=Macrococcoides goetzii TaxID=1891097 RepID=A0A2G5NUC6_9STAP|nr:accessory Sec system protein Asp3 [Macrococcus goetzii]RAI78917.1 accessory Sec system protein Asp3 [Macrococcus goetzii]
MESNRYSIQWNNIDQSFMYGTIISQNDGIHFTNYQTPAGIPIHEWKMTTDFYSDKTTPDLPILRRGGRYTFSFHYKAIPETGIYFKITFYRRNETVTHEVIIQEKEVQLTVPDDCYSYKIEMMSASIQTLHFQSIEITGEELMDAHASANILNRYLLSEENEVHHERNH